MCILFPQSSHIDIPALTIIATCIHHEVFHDVIPKLLTFFILLKSKYLSECFAFRHFYFIFVTLPSYNNNYYRIEWCCSCLHLKSLCVLVLLWELIKIWSQNGIVWYDWHVRLKEKCTVLWPNSISRLETTLPYRSMLLFVIRKKTEICWCFQYGFH